MIVPGRNIADFAPAAIASLRAQTEEGWRAILVDDGSLDATGEIFEESAQHDPRFTVLRHAEARGLGGARNAALELVDTEFVGFLDADDELTPSALERLLGTITTTGSDFVAGAYVRLRPDGAGYRAGRVQPWVTAATDPERRKTTLAEHPQASGNIVAWSKVSRTAFWDDLRFPEGVAYEDQIVAQLMYTRAASFDVIPDPVVRWRVRGDGTSITQSKTQLPVLRDYLKALDGGIRVLADAGYSAAVLARIELILAMDIPPLLAHAEDHPDLEYRAALSAFVEGLQRLPEYSLARPDRSLKAGLDW